MAEAAATSAIATHSGFGTPSASELNDLNSRLAPALSRADEFDALWSVWGENGDYVAATAAGLAAAACRAVVNDIHAAWFALRRNMQMIDGIDLPLVPKRANSPLKKESTARALNRVVAEIKKSDKNLLASVRRTMRRLGDEGLRERAIRIRKCPEWSNRNGILHNHPPEACVILFHKLLVSPPVYMEVRGDLAKIATFRRDAIAFREKVEAHEKELREAIDSERAEASRRPTLSGLTGEENEQFHDLLDSICAGDIRTRHGNKDSERIATVRLIAEHFRSFLKLSRAAATELFNVEPWSTGIAELAHAALYFQVTSEDVRGALKNWASD